MYTTYCRYGDGDGLLNELLKVISGGQWDFVWAQQYFSLTDQLNFGTRYLMLDPVYFWGAMRLCHCGTTFKWIDKVIDFVEKVCGYVYIHTCTCVIMWLQLHVLSMSVGGVFICCAENGFMVWLTGRTN
jgi:hypothetical protein